jgi:Trk K+ transport system NAD-binding subunit
VAVARALAARLQAAGQNVALVHRDVAKQAGDAAVVAGDPLTESAKRRDGGWQ